MENPYIIDNKHKKDICLYQVVFLSKLKPFFIFLTLGLVPKHDGGFYQIHYLSKQKKRLVNNHIQDNISKLKYKRLQKVLDLIFQKVYHSIVIKRDIKDAFQNILILFHYQWLLCFIWKNRFYKKTCLLFGLATTLFIFKLSGKGLYQILVSVLQQILCHYRDDFITIFDLQTPDNQLQL